MSEISPATVVDAAVRYCHARDQVNRIPRGGCGAYRELFDELDAADTALVQLVHRLQHTSRKATQKNVSTNQSEGVTA